MKLQKKNPISNSLRHQYNLRKHLLTKKTNIIKSLIKNFKTYNGRSSNNGRITVRHKGGGLKKKFHT